MRQHRKNKGMVDWRKREGSSGGEQVLKKDSQGLIKVNGQRDAKGEQNTFCLQGRGRERRETRVDIRHNLNQNNCWD